MVGGGFRSWGCRLQWVGFENRNRGGTQRGFIVTGSVGIEGTNDDIDTMFFFSFFIHYAHAIDTMFMGVQN